MKINNQYVPMLCWYRLVIAVRIQLYCVRLLLYLFLTPSALLYLRWTNSFFFDVGSFLTSTSLLARHLLELLYCELKLSEFAVLQIVVLQSFNLGWVTYLYPEFVNCMDNCLSIGDVEITFSLMRQDHSNLLL